jgi:hypothetical protein
MNLLVQELLIAICLQGNKYALEFKEYVKTDNNFSIVMQLCNGGNLFELINYAHP